MNDPKPIDVTTTAVAVRPANTAVGEALPVEAVLAQVRLIQDVMRSVMKDKEHYGTIPGCGDKKTLFQPGAQKLCMTFRLAPEYLIQETTLERGHKEYRVVCVLKSIGTGSQVGSGVGACSTMESKYRFRVAPKKATDRPVPKEYWDCWKTDPKRAQEILGGPGFSKVKTDSGWFIAEGSSDKVEHDNPADNYNTVLKMAKKRAFVDATITATAASDIFTQDVGDPESDSNDGGSAPAQAPEAPAPRSTAPPEASRPMTRAEQRPMESAEDKAKAAKKKEKELLAWLETCKAEFLKRIASSPFLWAWWKLAVDEGWMMPVEILADAPAAKIFPEATPDKSWAQIKAYLAERYAALSGKAQEIAEQTDKAAMESIMADFRDAYDSPLNGPEPTRPVSGEKPAPPAENPVAASVPRDPDAGQVGEWWRDVKMPFGRDKGTRLEDLDKSVLFGWWANFTVSDTFEGKDGRAVKKKPEQIKADTELRKALDAAGEHYQFEKKD